MRETFEGFWQFLEHQRAWEWIAGGGQESITRFTPMSSGFGTYVLPEDE